MSPKNYRKNNLPKSQNSGFGLIELLVSFSILTLVLGAIMVRQDSFDGAILLRNQAYEIALHAREVQMYAVSILGDSGQYRNVYGLYFNKTGTNKNSYKIYQDANSDFYYQGSEEFGIQGKLESRFEIENIRTLDSNGNSTDRDYISVIFQRPNFDARFFSGANTEINASILEIDVALRSDASEIRTIEITKTGQISVKDMP